MTPVSHNTRKRKREQAAARKAARKARTDETARRYFLTVVKRDGSCDRCAGRLPRGGEMVYRLKPRLVYCVLCAEALRIAPTPSMRWEQSAPPGRIRPTVRGGRRIPMSTTDLITDDIIDAIDNMIAALQVEPDERAAFAQASRAFIGVMAGWSAAHDRADWPPVATLVALEQELLARATEPDDAWIDRTAAVRTLRDTIAWARGEQARLN